MAVPEEYGGGLHNDVVAPYLLQPANDEQKPKFCTG